MTAIIDHVGEYWPAYLIVIGCLVPLIIIFRKYAVPVLKYVFELLIYAGLLHGLLHLVVRLAAWFKVQSSFERAFGQQVSVDWEIPLNNFWRPEMYEPRWLLYLELAIYAVIVYLVIKFRPMKRQKVKPRKPKYPPAGSKARSRHPRQPARRR